MTADDLLVTLRVGELRELVRAAVREEVARLPSSAAEEVLKLPAAAEFIGRTPKITMQLVKAGKLRAHFISEREPRFKRSDLIAFIDSLPTQPGKKTGTDS